MSTFSKQKFYKSIKSHVAIVEKQNLPLNWQRHFILFVQNYTRIYSLENDSNITMFMCSMLIREKFI